MVDAHAAEANIATDEGVDVGGHRVIVRRMPSGSEPASGHGWLVALRMLLQFRRMTSQRVELRKP